MFYAKKKNKGKLPSYLGINLADDAWKLFLVFAVGVFVGWLIGRQASLGGVEAKAAGRGFTRYTDFTRDEQGRVISIVERFEPVELG
jgi:hypothetical protein